FDLVNSIKKTYKIQASAADIFVDNLVRHASGLILFSAAPPGQGGEFHVNEQPYDYWRRKFAPHGYVPCDCIRSQLARHQQVSFWYRYNTILYVHGDLLHTAPEDVRASALQSDAPIRDVSPIWFQLRKLLVQRLPSGTREWLAQAKARRFSH
ncbi:MAG: hypothetical protein ACRDHZ_19375, partial [Ktedonobacteraceae bacterium]